MPSEGDPGAEAKAPGRHGLFHERAYAARRVERRRDVVLAESYPPGVQTAVDEDQGTHAVAETAFPVGKVPRSEEDVVLEKQGVGEQDGGPVTHAVFQVVERRVAPCVRFRIESGVEIQYEARADAEVAVAGGQARQRAEERALRIIGARAGADERLVFLDGFAVFGCGLPLRGGGQGEEGRREQGGEHSGTNGRHGCGFLSIDGVGVLVIRVSAPARSAGTRQWSRA